MAGDRRLSLSAASSGRRVMVRASQAEVCASPPPAGRIDRSLACSIPSCTRNRHNEKAAASCSFSGGPNDMEVLVPTYPNDRRVKNCVSRPSLRDVTYNLYRPSVKVSVAFDQHPLGRKRRLRQTALCREICVCVSHGVTCKQACFWSVALKTA